jgi:hypothetical protein
MVPRQNLWVKKGVKEAAAPAGTVECVLAGRIAVKACAFGAPLRGFGP